MRLRLSRHHVGGHHPPWDDPGGQSGHADQPRDGNDVQWQRQPRPDGTHQGEVPDATDRDYTWRQVVVAAAVQGAIFGAAKAATERAGAVGYRKATGDRPAD